MKTTFMSIELTQLGWVKSILISAEILLIIFVMYRVYNITRIYRKIKSASINEPIELIRQALQPTLGKGLLLEMVVYEICVIYYSIVLWFKKPPLPAGRYFTYHETSQYKVITIVFIILIAIESVAVHFLFSIWSVWLAWIATALSIYTALYLIATCNSYRYLPHLLNEKRLLVRLGYQSSAEISLANIDKITAAKQIGLGEPRQKNVLYAHAPFDDPHFEIHLKEPIKIRSIFGFKKEATSIVLYADHYKEFESELKNSMLIDYSNLA